jgi:hypothetical protein
MTGRAPQVRLRQAVIAAAELEPVARELQEALDLPEPFRDPNVAEFGLHNAVFAIGDCFIEIISPTGPGTAAGRWLDRHGGDGGYMAIFDLEDLDGARERAVALGVRVVWQIDLPDISGTHLHPADMRGAIVSLDRSTPYGSWRWGGPAWMGRIGPPGAPGHLSGMTLAVADPAASASRWGEVLGTLPEGGGPALALDGGRVEFQSAAGPAGEGISEIAVELDGGLPKGAHSVRIGGVRIRCSPAATGAR